MTTASFIDTNAIVSKVKGFFSPSKEEKQAQYESAIDAMCAALTALNSSYNIEENEQSQDKVIYFKYQGMNFRAFTFAAEDNNDCNLDFHAGIYDAGDLEYLRQVCNKANSAVNPIHFYYIADTKENTYNLYATSTLTNVTELSNLQELLNKTLENYFIAQRNFTESFKKIKEEDTKTFDQDDSVDYIVDEKANTAFASFGFKTGSLILCAGKLDKVNALKKAL